MADSVTDVKQKCKLTKSAPLTKEQEEIQLEFYPDDRLVRKLEDENGPSVNFKDEYLSKQSEDFESQDLKKSPVRIVKLLNRMTNSEVSVWKSSQKQIIV